MNGNGGSRVPASQIRDEAGSWPVASSAVLSASTLFTLRRDQVTMPDGDLVEREVLEHPGAVAVVALNERAEVLMIHQYRHPAAATLWEIPAGLRDVRGEPPADTARRELLEEGCCLASDWRVLIDYFSSPGITTERIRVFLARNLTLVREAEGEYVRHHEEAYLTLAWVPLEEAVRRALSGDLHNGVAISGVLSAYVAQRDGFASLRHADDPEAL